MIAISAFRNRGSNANRWYQMGLPKYDCPYLPIQISSLRADVDPSLPPPIVETERGRTPGRSWPEPRRRGTRPSWERLPRWHAWALGDRWRQHVASEMLRSLDAARSRGRDHRGQLLETRPIEGAGLREEYRLTEKGRDTLPILIALLQWGDRWLKTPKSVPMQVIDRRGGRPLPRMRPVERRHCRTPRYRLAIRSIRRYWSARAIAHISAICVGVDRSRGCDWRVSGGAMCGMAHGMGVALSGCFAALPLLHGCWMLGGTVRIDVAIPERLMWRILVDREDQ